MHLSQFHYLPLTPGFFSILIALFVGLLVIMIVLGALRHAYLSLGVSPGTAMLLLLASLIGSYFNIPIAALPPGQVESDKVIGFFGMQYAVPMVENLPGTVIAINVGGAVIQPSCQSICSPNGGCGCPGRLPSRLSRLCSTGLPIPFRASASLFRYSFRLSSPRSSRFCFRAVMQRRSLTSRAAWAL
jgi:hypothetical protein